MTKETAVAVKRVRQIVCPIKAKDRAHKMRFKDYIWDRNSKKWLCGGHNKRLGRCTICVNIFCPTHATHKKKCLECQQATLLCVKHSVKNGCEECMTLRRAYPTARFDKQRVLRQKMCKQHASSTAACVACVTDTLSKTPLCETCFEHVRDCSSCKTLRARWKEAQKSPAPPAETLAKPRAPPTPAPQSRQ